MRPRDTSPEAWRVWLELVRRMTPSERLQRALEYSALVRGLEESVMRRKHPTASDEEILLRLARRRLGTELFARVYRRELPA